MTGWLRVNKIHVNVRVEQSYFNICNQANYQKKNVYHQCLMKTNQELIIK
jgi:hypothetical protein